MPSRPCCATCSPTAIRCYATPALLKEKEKGKFRFLGITETSPNDLEHQMLLRAAPDGLWDTAMVADGRYIVRVVASAGDDGRWRVRPVGGQGSHQLAAAAGANALALVPDGEGVAAGASVEVLVLTEDTPS